MAKKLKEKYVRLQCTACDEIGYTTYQSNKRAEKLGGDEGLNKYCKRCKVHTAHKPTK